MSRAAILVVGDEAVGLAAIEQLALDRRDRH
jgi:hypothetical protein